MGNDGTPEKRDRNYSDLGRLYGEKCAMTLLNVSFESSDLSSPSFFFALFDFDVRRMMPWADQFGKERHQQRVQHDQNEVRVARCAGQRRERTLERRAPLGQGRPEEHAREQRCFCFCV